jgi:hypothetical protein
VINTLVIASSLALSCFGARANAIAVWTLADAAPAASSTAPAPPATPPTPAPPPTAPPTSVAPAPPSVSPATEAHPDEVIPAVPPPTGVPPETPTPPPPPPAATQPQPPAGAPAPLETRDEVRSPGYLPGYRTQQSLSLSPYAPTVGGLPGGLTPGFGAPMPFTQWTFRFSGFFTATLQGSLNRREVTGEGQRGVIYHTPPQTLDEYGSFVGTSTMPGQWVALNLSYGNPLVSANISLNTWNPSAPSTYYQVGSQYFINNAFLRFDIPAFGELNVHANVGYFYNYYGNLAQYGPGMYTQSIIGAPRGVGESVSGEYRVSPSLTLTMEDGLMGTRGGKVPDGVVPTGGNGGANPIFPAAYVHHLHLGVVHTGDHPYRLTLHWMTNWAQDDRAQRPADNPTTHFVDEAYIRDGRIDVVGVDGTVQDRTWGYLGLGASYTRGDNASVLRGMQTFGGTDGQALAERWFGPSTSGTGKMFAAGLNYNISLGRLLSGPNAFSNEQPDVLINAGFVLAYTQSTLVVLPGATTDASADTAKFNHRLRYKFGVDALYTFLSWMSAGVRVDRVAPTSKDSKETFYVLAPRVVFKRSWNSHESITLLYAKWFYGPDSHSEAGSVVPMDIGLDDQLVALNVNLYW